MHSYTHNLPEGIGNPATNALLAAGITTLEQVSEMSDKELLAIHGVGPKAVRILKEYIKRSRDFQADQGQTRQSKGRM